MLSCLTYNIQFGKKLPFIIQWMNSLEKLPDILCFQECPEEERFPTSSRLLSGLRGASKNYDLRFVQSLNTKRKSYGQLTLYDKTKLKVTNNSFVDLEKTLIEKIFSPNKINRKVLITSFIYKSKPLIVINSHLTSIHLNKIRRTQIVKIIDSLDKKLNTVATLFLGDLNYSSLLRQRKLLSLMGKYGYINGFSLKTHKLFFLRHQLDYVFFKNCRVVNPEVVKINYSDHYPIKFSLSI
jgi:endonuclease/exonuclease/phosphatase family metal-dependent hydrolase